MCVAADSSAVGRRGGNRRSAEGSATWYRDSGVFSDANNREAGNDGPAATNNNVSTANRLI